MLFYHIKNKRANFVGSTMPQRVTSFALTVAACFGAPAGVEPINGPLECPEMQEKCAIFSSLVLQKLISIKLYVKMPLNRNHILLKKHLREQNR